MAKSTAQELGSSADSGPAPRRSERGSLYSSTSLALHPDERRAMRARRGRRGRRADVRAAVIGSAGEKRSPAAASERRKEAASRMLLRNEQGICVESNPPALGLDSKSLCTRPTRQKNGLCTRSASGRCRASRVEGKTACARAAAAGGWRLSAVGWRLSAVGCRLSAVGCRLSAVGC